MHSYDQIGLSKSRATMLTFVHSCRDHCAGNLIETIVENNLNALNKCLLPHDFEQIKYKIYCLNAMIVSISFQTCSILLQENVLNISTQCETNDNEGNFRTIQTCRSAQFDIIIRLLFYVEQTKLQQRAV